MENSSLATTKISARRIRVRTDAQSSKSRRKEFYCFLQSFFACFCFVADFFFLRLFGFWCSSLFRRNRLFWFFWSQFFSPNYRRQLNALFGLTCSMRCALDDTQNLSRTKACAIVNIERCNPFRKHIQNWNSWEHFDWDASLTNEMHERQRFFNNIERQIEDWKGKWNRICLLRDWRLKRFCVFWRHK